MNGQESTVSGQSGVDRGHQVLSPARGEHVPVTISVFPGPHRRF
ncbi:MAG: hypothetical protein J07HX64_02888 [halophilic archaeon J07HX64]|nr:MAG: hypothetical protein J07HX64_02888 [halophilic archaeon J07HX64]